LHACGRNPSKETPLAVMSSKNHPPLIDWIFILGKIVSPRLIT
jgi:hypothetical protein